jgi:hypothetical protein
MLKTVSIFEKKGFLKKMRKKEKTFKIGLYAWTWPVLARNKNILII